MEEISGFDEDLAYGEDKDLRRRVSEHDFSENKADFTELRKVVSSWREVFHQGRWYGKSYLKFVRKYPQEIDSLFFQFYFVSIPIFATLSAFSAYFFYGFLLELFFFLYLCLESLRLGERYYAFFIPFVRFVRSIGMALGLVEGLFTDDLGKSA